MNYHIAAITHPGSEKENQDNFFCNGLYKKNLAEPEYEVELQTLSETHNIAAVFDGVGGLYDGSKAAFAACEALYDACWIGNDDVSAGLLGADRNIMETSSLTGHQMGSTCVVVEEKAGRFRSWNVGDSRSYYYSEGKLFQISKDHTEAENARTIQGITGESFQIPDKYEHILTQYLGADKNIYTAEPYVSDWISKGAGGKILLCSDGLYDFVKNETIISILKDRESTLNKCRALIDAAMSNNAKDNITVILIEDEH